MDNVMKTSSIETFQRKGLSPSSKQTLYNNSVNAEGDGSVHSRSSDVKNCTIAFDLPSFSRKANFKQFAGCGYVYSAYYDDRFEDGIRIVAFGYMDIARDFSAAFGTTLLST